MRTLRTLIAVLTLLALTAPLSAHIIPADITATLFVKPEGQKLRVLIRVPLASINDIAWPFFRGNGELLDLGRAEGSLRSAANQWLADFIRFYEDDRQLEYPTLVEVRASISGDQSFKTYQEALAHLTGPRLPADAEFVLSQGLLDVYYEYAINSDRAHFSIDPNFETLGLRVMTVMKFLPPDGSVRAFEYEGRRGLIHFDPTWKETTHRFLESGVVQFVNGIDYVLFAVCLIVPFRRFRTVLPIAGGYAVGYTASLFASAYGMAPTALWFQPLIVTVVATSILYVALENVINVLPARRTIIAFVFGIAYGFAFSFALTDSLQFAGLHHLSAIAAFALGIDIAVAATLLLVSTASWILFTRTVPERVGTIIVSALAAHTAWHWTASRYAEFARHPIVWPTLDAAFFAVLTRWLMIVVALCGLAWLVNTLRHSKRSGKVNSGV